jgi:hypothetical protein
MLNMKLYFLILSPPPPPPPRKTIGLLENLGEIHVYHKKKLSL